MAGIEARDDRIAPVYDLVEALPEQRFRAWREKLWAQVPEGRVLEVGIGTGTARLLVLNRQKARQRIAAGPDP